MAETANAAARRSCARRSPARMPRAWPPCTSSAPTTTTPGVPRRISSSGTSTSCRRRSAASPVPAAERALSSDSGARPRLLAPAAVLVASLLCFFALALLAHPSTPSGLDGRVNAFAAAHRSAALTTFFTGYTSLGQWLVLTAATAAVLAALAWRARRRDAVLLLIAMIVSPLLNLALKHPVSYTHLTL